MDRALPVPVNRSRAPIKRFALAAAGIMAVVFGVGAPPVVFLYFWAPSLASPTDKSAQSSLLLSFD